MMWYLAPSRTLRNRHKVRSLQKEEQYRIRVPLSPVCFPHLGRTRHLVISVGGRGGAGGYGAQFGGCGGLGEGAQISLEAASLFGTITGGTGGTGGASANKGGTGGTGEGSKFSQPLCSIDDETRHQLPYMTLDSASEDFKITPDLRQLLKDQGFQTVGSLFEVQEADLQRLNFKLGHVASLRVALRNFVARRTN
ncbi:hypothetical protein B0H12DRAFT_144673 [Mycena haematopus]|nr:hypothetical protein B0H12DRAFT_144673 [Mycena haematopus]